MDADDGDWLSVVAFLLLPSELVSSLLPPKYLLKSSPSDRLKWSSIIDDMSDAE